MSTTRMTLVIPLDDSDFSRAVFPYVERMFDAGRWRLALVHVARRPSVPLPAPVTAGLPYAVPGGTVAGGALVGGSAVRGMGGDLNNLGRPMAPAPTTAPGVTARTRTDAAVQAHDVLEAERRRLTDRLEGDARALREAGFEVSADVRFADAPADGIAAFVADRSGDAVAMATHGRTTLGRLFRGSVAETLVHVIGAPVFLVRAPDDGEGSRSAGTDRSGGDGHARP